MSADAVLMGEAKPRAYTGRDLRAMDRSGEGFRVLDFKEGGAVAVEGLGVLCFFPLKRLIFQY